MEFDLIDRYFKTPFAQLLESNGESVLAGIGDDCAALRPRLDHTLYVSTDTLVESVHFFQDDDPCMVGWKSLACNLSDLSACGATPLGFTLNLSLPTVEQSWLAGFSRGMLELAVKANCPLVGGDTTSAGTNALKTLSITVFGQAPLTHQGFHRSHGRVGDEIWVSGTPGLARLGLLLAFQKRDLLAQCCQPADLSSLNFLLASLPGELQSSALQALQLPSPRIELGRKLRGLAHACVDLSDGLGGDLTHIAQASGLSANLSRQALHALWLEQWPALRNHPRSVELLETLLMVTLQGGDDFELCWTAPSEHHDALQSLNMSIRAVGVLGGEGGVWLNQPDGSKQRVSANSYNHFSGSAL